MRFLELEKLRRTPLVIPRGHDCITLLLGSKEAYREYFDTHRGVYWYSAGWIERTLQPGRERYERTCRRYLEQYGEDNAAYLMEALGGWRSHYDRAAFVDMAVADPGAVAAVESSARDDAERRGWAFEKLAGELLLVRRLVDGDWGPEDFLVLQAGERLAMSYDEAVIRAEPAG